LISSVKSSTTFLQSEDLAAVLAMSASERAASALATSIAELTENEIATDRMTAILLKHFMVHFSGLQEEFEQFLGAMEFDADLAPTRAREG
jgi:hypothetical protein